MPKLPRLLIWTGSILLFYIFFLTLFRFVFYLQFRPASADFPWDAFLMGLRLDLRVACVLGLLIFILMAIPALDPFHRPRAGRFWVILLTSIFFLTTLLYITDFFHYEYLMQRLNASVISYLQDAGISFTMVWQTYPVVRGLLLLAALVWLAWWFLLRLTRRQQQRQAYRGKKTGWIIASVILLAAGTWGSLGQFALRWSDVFSLGDNFRAQLALNPVQSFISTYSFRNSTYDVRRVMEYYSLMADFLGIESPDSMALKFERRVIPSGPIPAGTRPNIILVICESFSGYKSSMWGNPLNPTPFFDSLCRDGVFFDRCFTPSYGTARGVWATITGIPDMEYPQTASRNPALVDQYTIINDFTGYEKLYFLGGSASWANIRGLLKNNIPGLKLFEQQDYDARQIDVWGVSDKNLLLAAADILEQQDKPFFAIIQTADNHRPYTIPGEDLDEFSRVEIHEDTLRRYGYISNAELNAFRYTDFGFRKFMEAARTKPYFANTVFVFIGDHGIRGDAGNMFPRAWTDQALTTVHVPLLFYAPGLLPPARHDNICSQLDIMPSIAGLASMPYRNNGLGKDLFDSSLKRNPLRYSGAFILDPGENKIGMISHDYYLRKTVGGEDYELVPVMNNHPLAPGPAYDSVRQLLSLHAEAFYETARYLLYNNRKPAPSAGQPAGKVVQR